MERRTIIKIKELHQAKCKDLINPKEEDDSTHSKDMIGNQKYFVKEFLVKSRKQPREGDKMMMGSIIKDLIMNKEEHKIQNEYEKKDSWGFKEVDEFL